jgi:hypothetical protein
MSELPLLNASRRLRKPAGRPKTVRPAPIERVEQTGPQASQAKGPKRTPQSDKGDKGLRAPARTVAVTVAPKTGPRLLSLEDTADYLAVSVWTIRAWWSDGMLHAVKPILPNGRPFRRLLFDRVELDALIEQSKEPA